MPKPRMMTDHTLEGLKGWPSPNAVDFKAPFDAAQLEAVSGNVAFEGRCVHLNNNGEYEFGCTGRQMALFLKNNSDDPDVANEGGDPATEAGAWVAVAPTGPMMAVPAKAAVELATTEFDTAQTYLPNDVLRAATGTTLATCGVLTNQTVTPYAQAVVGVVSRGVEDRGFNSHGKPQLAFWPVYLPVA